MIQYLLIYAILALACMLIIQSGFIPNVFKVLAHRPDEFRAFFNYYDVLMDSKRGVSVVQFLFDSN